MNILQPESQCDLGCFFFGDFSSEYLSDMQEIKWFLEKWNDTHYDCG